MNQAIRQRAIRAALCGRQAALFCPSAPIIPLSTSSLRRFQSSTSANFSHPSTRGSPQIVAARSETTSTDISTPPEPGPPLNPPTSTLPPPLDLPARTPGTTTFRHLLATGKAYLTFYKTGLKAVLTNFRAAKQLLVMSREVADASGDSTSIPPLLFTRQLGPPPPNWTRADWVLYRRARHDILRMPAFGLMLLVFDELTPLAVWIFSGIVPLTCRIPKQIAEDEGKAEGRRHGSFGWLEMSKHKELGFQGLDLIDAKPQTEFLDLGPKKARIHAVRSLGIVGSKWDVVSGVNRIPFGAWWLKGESRMAFLEADDEFLRRGGISLTKALQTRMSSKAKILVEGVARAIKGLSDVEVRLACKDRGLDVRMRSDGEVRRDLVMWLWLTAGSDHEERRKRMTVLIMKRREDWPTRREFELPEWFL